jgi:hypothetical protein
VSVGEGDIGVCVWFRGPIMHRMLGRILAWHWYIIWEHLHLKSRSWIVCSGGLFLRLHALVNVKNRMFLLVCSVWVMRCIALLCRAIFRPLKYGCLHIDRSWG